VLTALSWTDIATYSFVLVFAVRNSVLYLIQQKRWDNIYLTAFYVLTISIAILRIYYFFCSLKELGFERDDNNDKYTLWFQRRITEA